MRATLHQWNGLLAAYEKFVGKLSAERRPQHAPPAAERVRAARFDIAPVELYDDFSGGFGLTESANRDEVFCVPK